MHDPMTVAHEIKWPFPKREKHPNGEPWNYYPPIITVWHNDPESDGTDDSCGWFHPKLTESDWKIIQGMVDWDKGFHYYTSQSTLHLGVVMDAKYLYEQLPPGQCFGFVATAWSQIAWERDRRRMLSLKEINAVVNLSCNANDNICKVLCDPEKEGAERANRFLMCVMKAYLRYHRPWYKHPRWHIRHWSFQIHPSHLVSNQRLNFCQG